MKILLLCLNVIFLYAITLTVNVKMSDMSYKSKKNAKIEAKKKAIEKYIKRINSQVSNKIIKEITDEYPNYINNVILEDISDNTATYSVDIDEEAVNTALNELGADIQANNIELFIVEEPLSLANMSFDNVELTMSEFVTHYSDFQRIIRDTIIKKANEAGIQIKLLSDNPDFKQFVTRDKTLVGVYYDPDEEKFIIDDELYKKLSSYENAIAISYRIDNLYLDRKNRTIRVKISLNLKNLNNSTTNSIGFATYEVPIVGRGYGAVLDAFENAVNYASSIIMNNGKEKLLSLLMAQNNKPIDVIIKMHSKMKLYKIKKELQKHFNITNVSIANYKLHFNIKYKDTEEFVFDKLIPILERYKSIDDNDISIKGKNVTINL